MQNLQSGLSCFGLMNFPTGGGVAGSSMNSDEPAEQKMDFALHVRGLGLLHTEATHK